MATDDRQKSLEELEGYSLGEPEFESGLVLRCHELWKKPLAQFSPGDLRIMISQGFSLPYLVPLALELLDKDPLMDAEYYEGDLLSAMVEMDPLWLQPHLEWVERTRAIAVRAMEELNGDDELDLSRKLNAFLARFEDRH